MLLPSRAFRRQLAAIVAAIAAPGAVSGCCTSHVETLMAVDPFFEGGTDASADGTPDSMTDASPVAPDATMIPDAATSGPPLDCAAECRGVAFRDCSGYETEYVACSLVGSAPRTVRCEVRFISCPHHPVLFAACGRRSDGLSGNVETGHPLDGLGDLFARFAALEAESVPAFERLARELTAHSAPRHLVRAARAAARDERRHATAMSTLAARFGASFRSPEFSEPPTRELEAMAVENAIEGCVHETFGAILALHQAQHARDTDVRATMRIIARDEARHAWLAWEIDAWVRTRLDAEAVSRVDAARSAAVEAIDERSSGADDTAMNHAAGLPDAHAFRTLYRVARESLWS